jgi:3-phosphoshikimate 1-carboxyvinyltransferase
MASMTRSTVTIHVPGDKSISHRALMFAALARGQSRISGILRSADVRSTAGVMRALGATVDPLDQDVVRVTGAGFGGLQQPGGDLDCGNSGTTTRLCAGIVSGTSLRARFIGDASLSRRPMKRVAAPLTEMGARFEFERGDGLPMIVHGGAARSISWTSETASAQIKSAILLAGLVGRTTVTVTEPRRSRDHTERMLSALGATVIVDGERVTLIPPSKLEPLELQVPGDPSSAAFFAAFAALGATSVYAGRDVILPGICLNETRLGFFYALARMGAEVEYLDRCVRGGEETGAVRVSAAALNAISIGHAEVPSMIDELPMLACLASQAEGETVIAGAGELRVKESDRIRAVVENLRAVGVDADELPDGMRIRGRPSPLSGRVITHGDHRLAMAFAVLGAATGGEIIVDDPACVDVSYPTFWHDLDQIRQ